MGLIDSKLCGRMRAARIRPSWLDEHQRRACMRLQIPNWDFMAAERKILIYLLNVMYAVRSTSNNFIHERQVSCEAVVGNGADNEHDVCN